MPAVRWGVLALLAAVIAPITAWGADIAVIRVFPPECPQAPVSPDDFVDALRVELAGRQPHCCVVGPSGSADAANDAVKVTLSIDPCDAATQQVGVRVDVATPARTIERQVSLADLPPEARPRALALAVAELVRSAGEAAPVEAAPPPPPPQAGGARPLVSGGVAAEVRRQLSHATTLWGPRLGLSVALAGWEATLDAGAAFSRTDVNGGSVDILLASATLFAGPRFALGPVGASVGPAGTFGWARISGQSGDPAVGTGEGAALVATIGLRAAIEAPAARMFRAFGYVDGGMTVRRLDAIVDGEPAAGISGPYLMLAAGVRFGPGR